MTYSAFDDLVDDLLGTIPGRIGTTVAGQLTAWKRLAIAKVQQAIPYYRKGITTTWEHDDLTLDGYASRSELPAGCAVREWYHVKHGATAVRRPLHRYAFSNRHDLVAGQVSIGGCGAHFYYAVDPRGGRTFWAYPAVTEGYSIQVVWDAVLGVASEAEYDDTDEVPFDEVMADAVAEYIFAEAALKMDDDARKQASYLASFGRKLALLNANVENRLRDRTVESRAEGSGYAVDVSALDAYTAMDPTLETVRLYHCLCCGCVATAASTDTTIGLCSPVVMPQTEWVMVGCSGERATIADTVDVARAIKGLDPEFVVHLGSCAPGTNKRPTDTGAETEDVEACKGGSAHLLHDLVLKHYWNYLPDNFYLAFGPEDLESNYGTPLLNVLEQPRDLIGNDRRAQHQLWYTFARGEVRFIVLNSGSDDDDTYLDNDTQLAFVETTLATAEETWCIVVFHRAAYSSDSEAHPGSSEMATLTDALRDLGVDLVVTGDGRNYERIIDSTGMTHVNCGTGGQALNASATTLTPQNSQVFYSSKHGFLKFSADDTYLEWEYQTVDGEVIDRVKMKKADLATETATSLEYVTRFQLDWAALPKDLDLHLKTPEIDGTAYHIRYNSRGSDQNAPWAKLRADKTDGTGPEIIDIVTMYPGTYRLFVHNYQEDQGNTGELKDSEAILTVTKSDSSTQTINVPTSGDGNYWNVLTVDGATGDVTVVNTIGETEPA